MKAATLALEETGAARPTADLIGLYRNFGGPNVLDNIFLRIDAGSFVALLGKSGSGKSTMLRLLLGLDKPSGGEIHVTDRRAVVFQEPRLVPWMPVLRNVTLGLRTPNPETAALQALEEVGLTHRIKAWPLTLSGGEAQRVALARALVRRPELMLLDEPFAALDALTRIKMQGLVMDLWRAHHPSILFVTHDVEEAILLADRVLVLDRGRISLDVTLDLPRPRRLSDTRFDRYRRTFLSALGVDPDL